MYQLLQNRDLIKTKKKKGKLLEIFLPMEINEMI